MAFGLVQPAAGTGSPDRPARGARVGRRVERDSHRAAHADHDLLAELAAGRRPLDSFGWITLDVPTLSVDTGDGYRPASRTSPAS